MLCTLYSHYQLVNTSFLKEIASFLIKCLDYIVGTGLTILEIEYFLKSYDPQHLYNVNEKIYNKEIYS